MVLIVIAAYLVVAAVFYSCFFGTAEQDPIDKRLGILPSATAAFLSTTNTTITAGRGRS
jgi:hypothetical protein